jgi:tetratricopeptide (TPR) repeat protein
VSGTRADRRPAGARPKRRAIRAALLVTLLAPPSLARTPSGREELLARLRDSLELGDLQQAVELGERAVSEYPGSSVAHDLLGRAYGLKAQQSQLVEQVRLARRARAFFAKAVELDPGNVSARADLATYDMRAPGFLGGGKEKARRQAEEVLKLDPARGHELLGDLAEREKDFAEAENEYRRAVEASPRSPGPRESLSSFLVGRKRYEDARRLWRDALAADPRSAAARYELAGIALASKEGLESAAADLENALQDSPDGDGPSRAEMHARLAFVWEALGRRPGARSELEEALRLSPFRTEWRKTLARWRK